MSRIVHENVPVYASSNVKLCGSGSITPVTAKFSFNVNISDSKFLFEGKTKNHIQSVDGVVCFTGQNDPSVIVKCTGRDSKLVRENDYLGRVSTIVELEPDNDSDEAWNATNLCDKVNINQELPHTDKERIISMLLRTQAA